MGNLPVEEIPDSCRDDLKNCPGRTTLQISRKLNEDERHCQGDSASHRSGQDSMDPEGKGQACKGCPIFCKTGLAVGVRSVSNRKTAA